MLKEKDVLGHVLVRQDLFLSTTSLTFTMELKYVGKFTGYTLCCDGSIANGFQWPKLNIITSGPHISDNNIQMIQPVVIV